VATKLSLSTSTHPSEHIRTKRYLSIAGLPLRDALLPGSGSYIFVISVYQKIFCQICLSESFMKKAALVLVAFVCLQLFASAVPDSVNTGPYKISFDLGLAKDAYKSDVEEPKSSEALDGTASETYSFELTQANNTTMPNLALISIYVAEQTVVPSAQRVSLNKKEIDGLGLLGVQAAARQIDGKDGVVCSGFELENGKTMTTYFADYYLSNREKVFIYSGFPWDSGTLALIKTIHIERINVIV
jgi:hypothetical protein